MKPPFCVFARQKLCVLLKFEGSYAPHVADFVYRCVSCERFNQSKSKNWLLLCAARKLKRLCINIDFVEIYIMSHEVAC